MLGRRFEAGLLSANVTAWLDRSDDFTATGEFMFWLPGLAEIVRADPTGVFDKGPYGPDIQSCHLAVTERRRQAVPNGGG
ncbi:hypothetical protein TOC8171_31790 [Pseudomonas syringae]